MALARAIVREPNAFLMDEPLSNLDAKLRVSTRAQIKNLHHTLKTTTIYVTHDQIEAMTLADRVVVMSKGVVQQVGTPTEIYDRPANTFVAGFIGSPAMNLIAGTDQPTAPSAPTACRSATSPPDGPVTLGFRAEDASVSATPAQITRPGLFDGTSGRRHPGLGPRRPGAGRRPRAQGLPHRHRRALHISVPPPAVHLFDAATGTRL